MPAWQACTGQVITRYAPPRVHPPQRRDPRGPAPGDFGRRWIVDFKQFSNISLCIMFQMPSDGCAALWQRLVEAGLRLDDESTASLRGGPAQDEVMGTLQITFIHDDPDLRREVPPIPG